MKWKALLTAALKYGNEISAFLLVDSWNLDVFSEP